MTTMLILNASPALEDDLVDFLLEYPGVEGFTSFAGYGHGNAQDMTVTEQVAGRRKRVQFQIVIDAKTADSLIGELGQRVGQDIVYWQLPASGLGKT